MINLFSIDYSIINNTYFVLNIFNYQKIIIQFIFVINQILNEL